MIERLKRDIKCLDEELKTIKKDFEYAIKDQNIPLDERWELFRKSPEYLSNVKDFYELSDKLKDKVQRACERYQQYDIYDYLDEDDENYDKYREELLAENIKTVVFDW